MRAAWLCVVCRRRWWEKEDRRRASGGRRRGSGEETGVEARENERGRGGSKSQRRERERSGESCVFPGCSSRGGVKTLLLRQSRLASPILRCCDSLRAAFLEASPPRKNRRKKGRDEQRARPLAPRSLFFAFREPLRGQWHIREPPRKEALRNR